MIRALIPEPHDQRKQCRRNEPTQLSAFSLTPLTLIVAYRCRFQPPVFLVSQQRHTRRTQRQGAVAVVIVVRSRDSRYRRRGGAVAVRSGPRVPGERLRAAEEHQPGVVPEPEQQQPGRDGRVQSGRQPERAGRRRRRGSRQERAVDQVQQIVRERRARTARQHAQRRHTVAGRQEDDGETAVSMGSAPAL